MDLGRDLPLIVLLAVAFLFAVFIAAAETSLLRIPVVRAASLAEEGNRRARRLAGLLEDLPRVLNAILLSALLAQIGAATVAGLLAERWFGGVGITIASVLLTMLLFVYSEAIPKTYAVRHTDRVALALAAPIAVLERLLRPLVSMLVWFADLQAPGKGITTSPTVTEDELRRLALRAAREGEITEDDLGLIERAFRVGDRQSDDVMVPRIDVVAIPAETPVEDAVEIALAAGHRRLPVYEEGPENITGVVRLRDLVSVSRERPGTPVGELGEEPLVVPETKRVLDLLREMQASRTHLAIVVDEYGGTAGLVTIEDIAEELLGSITDEGTLPSIEQLADDRWSIDAQLPVEDLDEILDVDVPEGEWNTAAGLVLGMLGHVPEAGDAVRLAHHRIVVSSVRRRRIVRLEVIRTGGRQETSP